MRMPCATSTSQVNLFYQNLYEYFNSGTYCDLTFIVGCKRFSCHRIILASSSPYFQALLTYTFKENRFKIPDKDQIASMDIYVINNMVNHICNGHDREKNIFSPDAISYQSKFSHTKRRPPLNKNQINFNGHSQRQISSLIDKFKVSSASPPPPPYTLTDESDDNDECNSSTQSEHITNDHSPKSILLNTFSGYQRKKSHSVKLLSINSTNSCPKKAVHFADDSGLDLSQIKMITSAELPSIPIAVSKDLQITNHEDSCTLSNHKQMKTISYMESQFENPIHAYGFNDRVTQQKILLEQANAIDNRIYGTVKLYSIGLHKQVRIRLTTDNWISSRDSYATYIPDSYDDTYDRFSFTLEIDRDRICAGNNIQFCICYESFNGLEYWDNNNEENYRFNCLSRTIPDDSI
ncbi:unnamed protein product [Adineta steineri]|uniref:Uncharacterized protein n=1 Tax=Adineta steineri TaxID=433720 RepID=A0A819R9S9_9BILA|nr:unnamed protein product [Adineta steineri]CAF4044434.1 unnamed protein product [Adineta steineri]